MGRRYVYYAIAAYQLVAAIYLLWMGTATIWVVGIYILWGNAYYMARRYILWDSHIPMGRQYDTMG